MSPEAAQDPAYDYWEALRRALALAPRDVAEEIERLIMGRRELRHASPEARAVFETAAASFLSE